MRYEYKGKAYNINDKELENLQSILEISKEEAIQVWLEDNEIEINEEQEKLTEKAKDVTRKIHQARDDTKKRSGGNHKKPDENKKYIIDLIYNALKDNAEIENLKIENPTKIITFNFRGREEKIDLIQKNRKK